jgi:hypothetical protein
MWARIVSGHLTQNWQFIGSPLKNESAVLENVLNITSRNLIGRNKENRTFRSVE